MFGLSQMIRYNGVTVYMYSTDSEMDSLVTMDIVLTEAYY